MGEEADTSHDSQDEEPVSASNAHAESSPDTSSLLGDWGQDLTQRAREGKLNPVIGREAETERVMQVLCRRTHNNPVLVSEPGIGKMSVVENLARKIVKGEVPDTIKAKQLYTLDLNAMKAVRRDSEAFERHLESIFEQVSKRDDLILFIGDLHILIRGGEAKDAIDVASMFKAMLERGELQVIGATTLDEYQRYMERDSALERLFQPIEVAEPTVSHTIEILKSLRERYEAYHRVSIMDDALVAAAQLADRYISDRFLPDKAIDLIDEAGSRMRIRRMAPPADLQEYDDKINQIRGEKESAIDSQDFEKAAALRDVEKQLLAKKAAREKEWRDGELYVAPQVDQELITEIVASLTGIPVLRILEQQADLASHDAFQDKLARNSGENYTLLNDQPPDNPAGDLLGTMASAATIASLLTASRTASPLVLAIDGGWGIGKSTMLRQIESCLANEQDIACVHFNAWTAQGGNALEGLIKSVLGQLDANILRRYARRLSGQRGIVGIGRILTLVAARFLGVTRLVDELWSRLAVDAKSRNEMRDIIGSMLSQWMQHASQSGRVLVVFIDDLDRCADEVIIQVCEAVKLYLDTQGLIFVLACDLSVLARGAATSARGGEGEGRAYLEKIIQVAYRVPPPDDAKTRELIRGYGDLSGTSSLLNDVITEILTQRAGRNPRRIKRIINSFVLEYRLNPAWREFPLDSSLLVIAILIQHLYSSFYDYLVSGDAGDDPIGTFLDYASVRARASNPPPSDHAWWAVVRRTLQEHGIPPPDRSSGTSEKLMEDIGQLENLLPEVFPALARSADFVALLRSIGDKETRQALRAQLISRPLVSEVVDHHDMPGQQEHVAEQQKEQMSEESSMKVE